LGYFDGMNGKNGKAYVMPIVEKESEGYIGVEYVGLYYKIVEKKSNGGRMRLYIDLPDEYVSLRRALD
jgi:hypothetical protein